MATPTQADLDYLRAHPEVADKFRARFGSLPSPAASSQAAPQPTQPVPAQTLPAASPTPRDIEYLKANPGMRGKFEARFGSAARYMDSPAPQQQQAQAPGFGEWAADQAGFLGKRALNAAISIPGLPADVLNLVARNTDRPELVPFIGGAVAIEKARIAREGENAMVPLGGQNIREAFGALSGGAITPRAPRNRAEEYAGTAADFVGGSVGTGAGILGLARGAAARGTAGPVLRGIANNPGRFVASEVAAGVGGGIGSEAARDIAPDSSWAPVIGSVVGAISPSALTRIPSAINESAKFMVRGGNAGRHRVADALADFQRAGTTPSAAQASQSTLAQYVEGALRYAPGAMSRMRTTVERQAEAIGARVRAMADNMSPNADPVSAGQSVQRGITGPGGFMEGFRQSSARLYRDFDGMMPAQTQVQPARTLQELAHITSPIAGAPNVSGVVANNRLGQVAQAIADDVAASGGSLPYDSLRQLRSWVGRQLETSELVSELPRAQLQRVYGALSDDMRNAAAQQGPGALRAFERANRHYRAGIARVDEHLQRLTNMGATPERIFESLWQGRTGETFLNRVRRSVSPHEWRTVAAAAMRRMGDASDGAQNAAGSVFSPETFLTRWNSLSPGARNAFFGGYGTLRQDLDAIARATERMRAQAAILRNSSGTAGSSIATGTALTAGTAALTGNIPVVAGIAGAMLLNNVTARMMTSPRFVRWLSEGVRARPNYIPAHMAQLTAIAAQDPELREDIQRYLDGLRSPEGAQTSQQRAPELRATQ